jgi:hypothetical protein
MRNLLTRYRDRMRQDRVFECTTAAHSGVIAASDPAGRARALREFAAACRTCADASPAGWKRTGRLGDLPGTWTAAAELAEAAAYSEQWLAEGHLDGTLPGSAGDFGGAEEREAWKGVFTAVTPQARARAYSLLAGTAEQRAGTAAVTVLRALSRAYLIQAHPVLPDPGTRVTIIDPKRAPQGTARP